MSTIKEVAERSGVSIGTVSHVINGSVRVSKTLRERVEAAIRELDYHPNHVARSLRTSKTRTLGIIVPDMTIPFYPEVIRGAESAATAHNHFLIAVNSSDDSRRQKELLSLLHAQRVEGVLLVFATGPAPTGQISRLINAGIPVVCLDRVPQRLNLDSVSVDNNSAIALGISHLIEQGHRRISIVTGPLTLNNEQERLQSFRSTLEEAGLPFTDQNVLEGNLRVDDVAAMCRDRLRANRPDALFATNGPTGLGLLRALRDLRLRTPEDIAVATFDELTVDDLFSPHVTTVVQPAFDIGRCATEVLLNRIEHGSQNGEPVTVRLPATLKVRESSVNRKATLTGALV